MHRALDAAIAKADCNISKIGTDLREFPGSREGLYFACEKSRCLKLSHIFNWTQSFFLGMGYWAYRITEDKKIAEWLYNFYDEYYSKVFDTPMETMHDLGFLYSPYAVALYKLNGDERMKTIGVRAADELAKRFIPNGKYIRAWGRMDDVIPDYVDKKLAGNHFFTESKGLAIIDCMMNLPLLFWASEVTGHPYYKNIAVAHADTTLEYFVRDDYSVCHAYRFSEATGEPLGVANYCGYSEESHWARGTAWAIYGFALAYSYTNNEKYLSAARNLAKKFISLCGDDGIPMWDFKLPESTINNCDTSAAVITICGINELLRYVHDDKLSEYAESILSILAEKYTDFSADVPGLLKLQNGNMTYSVYGDYFFMEALAMKLHGFGKIW